MSRIHEALQKARQQGVSVSSDLPNVEDIIAARLTSSEPEPAGDIAATAVPVGMVETVSEPVSAESTGAVNVSSIVGRCPSRNWPIHGRNLVFLGDDSHAAGQEQFRTLRSRLYQIQRAGSLQVICMTSAVPGEGKSFVSANLAHAFALQGEHKVLIIDADMRRVGGLSNILECPTGPGLSDYLAGGVSAESVVQSGSLEGLYLIPCGTHVSNSGELVGNSRFHRLIEVMRDSFDWILIDTPPVVPLSDARIISEACDGVLLVVGARSTPATLAKRAMQEFTRDKLLGVVLNRSTEGSASYYSSYGYGYHYGQTAASKTGKAS